MNVEPGAISTESDDDWFLSDPPEMDPAWSELQRLSRQELEAEVRRVQEEKYELLCYERAYGVSEIKDVDACGHRVWLIGRIMGEEQREKVLAPVDEKWKEIFSQLELDIEEPRECKGCGKLAGFPDLAVELCWSCRNEGETNKR